MVISIKISVGQIRSRLQSNVYAEKQNHAEQSKVDYKNLVYLKKRGSLPMCEEFGWCTNHIKGRWTHTIYIYCVSISTNKHQTYLPIGHSVIIPGWILKRQGKW